jgi:hypothetical protein
MIGLVDFLIDDFFFNDDGDHRDMRRLFGPELKMR